MWAFEAHAEGLVTKAGATSTVADAPPQQLYKTSRNNDLFDASGRPLAANEVQEATTWRTHHAFGGRCALVKTAMCETQSADAASPSQLPSYPGYPSGPSWAEQALAAYQNWSIAFCIRATTAEEPHILLSVAPAYFPLLSSSTGETCTPDAETLASLPAAPTASEQQHYNDRLLDTPLIWEEAYALSVECTQRGLFLWSDHWELYGKKIADRCLEVQAKTAEAEAAPLQSYEAAVRLRYHSGDAPHSVDVAAASTPSVLAVDVQASAPATKADKVSWQHVVDIPLPMDAVAQKASFRPHVTLLESGDSVEIL